MMGSLACGMAKGRGLIGQEMRSVTPILPEARKKAVSWCLWVMIILVKAPPPVTRANMRWLMP